MNYPGRTLRTGGRVFVRVEVWLHAMTIGLGVQSDADVLLSGMWAKLTAS